MAPQNLPHRDDLEHERELLLLLAKSEKQHFPIRADQDLSRGSRKPRFLRLSKVEARTERNHAICKSVPKSKFFAFGTIPGATPAPRLVVERRGSCVVVEEICAVCHTSTEDTSLSVARAGSQQVLKNFQNLKQVGQIACCRQGVGRTGTVILCDIALRAVPMTGKINMYGITKGLRKSRANMVVNSVGI
jgi:hypothetical protein